MTIMNRRKLEAIVEVLVAISIVAFIVYHIFALGFTVGYQHRKSEEIIYPDGSVQLFDMYETDARIVDNDNVITSQPTEEPIEEIEEVVDVKSYTDEELYILSHIIMGEAGGENDTCQLYVGSVVLNRVKSDKFPDTIKGVVFQKGQYSCVRDGGRYYLEPTERCIENAKYLLENGSVLPDYVIFQAMFKQGKGVYAEIDGEYFCY